MSVNCIILTGFIHNKSQRFIEKTAGPQRIATELRKNNFTVQIIDISYFEKFDVFLQRILKRIIQNLCEDFLSEEILRGNLKENETIILKYKTDKLIIHKKN